MSNSSEWKRINDEQLRRRRKEYADKVLKPTLVKVLNNMGISAAGANIDVSWPDEQQEKQEMNFTQLLQWLASWPHSHFQVFDSGTWPDAMKIRCTVWSEKDKEKSMVYQFDYYFSKKELDLSKYPIPDCVLMEKIQEINHMAGRRPFIPNPSLSPENPPTNQRIDGEGQKQGGE